MLYYQPKIALTQGNGFTVLGMEALIRWQHPLAGLLTPDRFIPVVAQPHIIVPLTLCVLHIALKQLAEWGRDGQDLYVAVNLLAPYLLTDATLPDRVAALLQEYGSNGEQLLLETTESSVMDDTTTAMAVPTRFRVSNVALSRDDFGTGYSSLLQLFRLPFSERKIDRSFVADVEFSEEARTIVSATVDLAHNLGLTVCAAGSETEGALKFLRNLACDSG